jgi:hypothetical protein
VTEVLSFEFTDPAGDPLRIEWETAALAGLDPSAPGAQPAWRLGGELDWDEVELLRVLSARLDDGALLAIVALRPAGAEGHGDDLVAGALGEDGALDRLGEALLSTEYGADGRPARVGLELYRDEDGLPVRINGDATASSTDDHGGTRRVSTALALRSGGTPGVGVLDLVSRA